MQLFNRAEAEIVELCDRCGFGRDASCRRPAVRERNLDRAPSARSGSR
jgi:hypothetical protein